MLLRCNCGFNLITKTEFKRGQCTCCYYKKLGKMLFGGTDLRSKIWGTKLNLKETSN